MGARQTGKQSESKLGFLDSLTKLFRTAPEGRKDQTAPARPASATFESLSKDFEAALSAIDARAEQTRRTQTGASSKSADSSERRKEERAKRLESIYLTMRQDIRAMHQKLGTGLAEADLDALSEYLGEVAEQAEAGRGSHDLLPRMIYAISEKFRGKSGELAVARLVALLQSKKLEWPDPIHHRPTAEPEEIERSRRRRLTDVRGFFAGQSLVKTSESMLGVVKAWDCDYPERGTPLWEETVLEGVAAGLRADLIRDSIDLLRSDRELLLEQAQEAIGQQLAKLHEVLESGGATLQQANQASAASLRALDEVVPELAWQHVQSRLPKARGEWGG